MLGRVADLSDSILITRGSGSQGILYNTVMSGMDFSLRTTVIPSIPLDSKLLVSQKSIERLRFAQVCAIVSDHSGAGLGTAAFDNLLSPLLEQFYITVDVHRTTSKTSYRDYITSIHFSHDHENVIIIFGGDTMVYELLNSLPNNPYLTRSHQITIFPVPCGTGNALTTSLGITTIPIGISRIFGVSESDPVKSSRLPVMKITIRENSDECVYWSAVVCSWGLHASLVADSDTPEMRREYGARRFVVAFAHSFHPNHRLPPNVCCRRSHIFIMVLYEEIISLWTNTSIHI